VERNSKIGGGGRRTRTVGMGGGKWKLREEGLDERWRG